MSRSSGAAVNRSPSRVLRDKGIDERITCTSSLVANYNAEEDPKGREALRKWLETHFDAFSQLRTGSITKKMIAEFVNLARVEVREPADAELVRRVYTTLHEIVMIREGCSVYFVLGLEHVLSITSNKILQEDIESLVALANRLITMTDPLRVPLTRATYEKCASCLHAFERVLMVLHDLEKVSHEQHILKFFEDKVKKHLSKVISCQHYYPFVYQALLIKENIKILLNKDIKSLLVNAGRRAFYAFCGGLYIFQGIRELAVLKFDFSAMESGVEKIQRAFKDIGWDIMPGVQEIVLAASESVEHDDFGIFQQCYDKYKRISWLEGLKWSKQRVIRYALVSHLCLFCTDKYSKSIQEPALDLLVRLIVDAEGKQWRKDEHIFEAMIDGLVTISKHSQKYNEKLVNAFHVLDCFSSKRQKKITKECLESKSSEESIKYEYTLAEGTTSRSLFQFTRQKLNLHRTASMNCRNREALKEYYKADSFAKVSIFANEGERSHIKTFDFNLEQCEDIVISQNGTDQSSEATYNQQENNVRRTLKVRKPINMQNLFETHGTPDDEFQEDAQRILVKGNPGTGKTCMSKRLCYDWAIGSWGSEFTHVYLLPIRKLFESNIGNDADLPIIIRKVIYKISGTQDNNNTLYEEIEDNLSKATTLLILDGYDEVNKMATDLVTSAFALNCSLLILSRPSSVDDIRPRVALEVECLEFSNKQLEDLVRKELGFKDADDLLQFLNANLFIRDTCRVAVNAQIVTKLWKSSFREKLIKSSCANLAHFYSMISKYIWTRFRDKEDRFDMNKTFDSLELVAFESFKEGMVEISEELIIDHAPNAQKIFHDSGFLLFIEEGSVFQFTHLTFHEYFAARHLAKLLKSANVEKRKRAERFISQNKYMETSQVMLSFMTQCYCMRDDIEGNLEAFADLMQVLDSEPLPTISLQHLLLRMRTLDAFLPCGLDKSEAIKAYNIVMRIVNDAMDALKSWFGYELGIDRERRILVDNPNLRAPIVDELARMSNLFYYFHDLLKPILLNQTTKIDWRVNYRRDIARIGRLNAHHALQYLLPILDDATVEERASLMELCAFIGQVCAQPTLDCLKKMFNDQDPQTRNTATRPLVAFLDLFTKREDIRQLVLDTSKDSVWIVRYILVEEIGFTTFTPETEVGNFIWDVLIEAMKDSNGDVRRSAFGSCVRVYGIFAKSFDEVMELAKGFALLPNFKDRRAAGNAIEDLIQKAPEKSKEILVLVKELCKDPNEAVRGQAFKCLLKITQSSCLRRDDLFHVALDLFKEKYQDIQLKLLPILFSVGEMEYHGIDEINGLVATSYDLEARIKEKATSCSVASALLAKYTIDEIYNEFYDQDQKVQLELVEQFDLREMEGKKSTDAIAKMAVHCLQYDEYHESSKRLLEKLSKTKLLPNIVLEQLAKRVERISQLIRQQPLSHLLQYYWSTKDLNIVKFVAEKLILSSVVFNKKGETQMTLTFKEKGAIVKQTTSVGDVQDLLSFSKDYVQDSFGLNFPCE